MKTHFTSSLIFCMSLCLSADARSQLIQGYGFKVGAAVANQHWDYASDNLSIPAEPRWGIDAGAFIELLDTPYLSALAELHYVQKGVSLTLGVSTPEQPDGNGETMTTRPRIDYLSLPVLLKLRFESTSFVPYIVGGPRFDLRIGQEAMDVYEKFEEFDFGITTGFGCALPARVAKEFFIELRYSPSLTNAFQNDFVTVKNTSFEMLLGLQF